MTANHSVRSALFARLRADHQGAKPGHDYDPELLFLACVLHDIGLTQAGDRHQRFEVDGADTAAAFLTAQGLPTADVDAVWEAVALHTTPGIAERRGTLCALVHQGTGMDFGWDTDWVDDAIRTAIHAAYPRLWMATTLTDEIVAQARRRPEKAPLFSIASELLRERSVPRTGPGCKPWPTPPAGATEHDHVRNPAVRLGAGTRLHRFVGGVHHLLRSA
ncbi:HD domain-containing protein [Streptomyces sp. NPDC006527]|uniref:HD domain-containing protein n=1 Tax=Streptomyces sp. NPDC006527 TaxID=3364749 RepID=UPI00368426B3